MSRPDACVQGVQQYDRDPEAWGCGHGMQQHTSWLQPQASHGELRGVLPTQAARRGRPRAGGSSLNVPHRHIRHMQLQPLHCQCYQLVQERGTEAGADATWPEAKGARQTLGMQCRVEYLAYILNKNSFLGYNSPCSDERQG